MLSICREAGVLAAILLLAGILRLAALDAAPPGINQDEAANAWDAYCLLETGRDQWGVTWPVFYIKALGEYRSTLFAYYLVPFLAVFDLAPWAARVGTATAGLLTVVLLYLLGRRLFDPFVGLAAALLLAVNPWHIELTRLAFEANMAPLFTCLLLVVLSYSGLPPFGDLAPRPRWTVALLAALVAGISCYGYFAQRLFVPVLLLGLALVGIDQWRAVLRSRRGRLATVLFTVPLAVLVSPLLWLHFTDQRTNQRGGGGGIWVWHAAESAGAAVQRVAERYLLHFEAEFLWFEGDRQLILSTPNWGAFNGYLLPLLLIGFASAGARFRGNPAARVALCWLLLYPFPDSLARADGVHMLRSAPALAAFPLLAALGLQALRDWLAACTPARLAWRRSIFAVVLLAILLTTGRYASWYWHEWARHPGVYHRYHADLTEAAAWLQPRWQEYDQIYFTTEGTNVPYPVVLVALGYAPEQWLADERNFIAFGIWQHCRRFGKVHFLYGEDAADPRHLAADLASGEVALFIVRESQPAPGERVHMIHGPQGEVRLVFHRLAASPDSATEPAANSEASGPGVPVETSGTAAWRQG